MMEITTIIPVVYMLSEALKSAGVQSRYIPLTNIALGAILGLFYAFGEGQSLWSVVMGIFMGLSAGGAYDGFKAIKGDSEDLESMGRGE